MKKLFCSLLTLAMFFSLCLPVGAAELQEAQQEELFRFGIMSGDETGELRLDDLITRAEAVKMLCTAGNLEGAEITEAFPDVSKAHWAFSDIVAAKSKHIICGDENGNFRPDAFVSNEEMVKMLVCLLGYGEMAEEQGGYPAGYTAIASKCGITSDLSLIPGKFANRNDVGIMVYNALSVPLMITSGTAENGEKEFLVLDGENGVLRKNLKTELEKQNAQYDTSMEHISKLAQSFALQYEYREGDTEKSFAEYPDVLYTSGVEKRADGKEYECPAVYDDNMVAAQLAEMQAGELCLFVNGEKTGITSYALYQSELLVPAELFRCFGCVVSFEEESYVLTIQKDETTLELLPNLIGMRKNKAEGFWVPLKTCARMIEGSLYVPLEGVAAEWNLSIQTDMTAGTLTVILD